MQRNLKPAKITRIKFFTVYFFNLCSKDTYLSEQIVHNFIMIRKLLVMPARGKKFTHIVPTYYDKMKKYTRVSISIHKEKKATRKKVRFFRK